jgi:hypothetical protein
MRWIVLLAALLLTGFQRTQTVADACPRFGVPVTGEGYSFRYQYTYTEVAGRRLLAFANDSFWVGYDAGAWAADYLNADRVMALTLWMTMPDGAERLLLAEADRDNPETGYVFVFANTARFADANGEHYGMHPCAAVRVPVDVWAAFEANLERR